jgi:hypothetical protein
MAAAGGEPEQITQAGFGSFARWSRDGKLLYYPRGSQLWEVNVETHHERPLTDFSGKPGTIGGYSLAADEHYLYFAWQEPRADLWTMDVVR